MYNTGNSSKNVTTTSIVDGTISNADVDASAAIAQSKLATLAITDSEVANDALSGDKIDGGTISDFASTGIDDNATSTSITIDSSQNVGINSTSPRSVLDVEGAVYSTFGMSSTHGYGSNRHWEFVTNDFGAASWGGFSIKTGTGVGENPSVTRFGIDASGNVEVCDGNLVIGTSGKGIDFSNTSDAGGMTSEVLDDYEEGTWTPVLNQSGTYTSTANRYKYIKIGKQVTISCSLVDIQVGTGGAGDDMYITGIPFATAESQWSGGVAINNVDLQSTTRGLSIYIASNSKIYLRQSGDDTSWHLTEWDEIANDDDIHFTTTYFTS